MLRDFLKCGVRLDLLDYKPISKIYISSFFTAILRMAQSLEFLAIKRYTYVASTFTPIFPFKQLISVVEKNGSL